jgi:hypothetical protein
MGTVRHPKVRIFDVTLRELYIIASQELASQRLWVAAQICDVASREYFMLLRIPSETLNSECPIELDG